MTTPTTLPRGSEPSFHTLAQAVLELQQGDHLDVKSYGATGDGVDDDTAAIQAALNAVPNLGGVVWFPKGTYKITSSLSVTVNGTILAGEGWGSQILFDGTVVTPAVSAASAIRVFMRDLRISQSNATSAGTAIDASNFVNGAIDRILIDGGTAVGVPPVIGVDYNGTACHYNALTDSRINVAGTNAIGVRYSNTANSNVMRNVRVLPSLSDASNTGVLVDATSIYIEHVDIENAAGTAVHITANGKGVTLVNPYFELNGNGLVIDSGAVSPTVIGGTIESSTTANITDNGSSGAVILGVRNSSVPYNHGAHNALRVPDNIWTPADHGLIAWSFDPAVISNGTVLTNGTAYFVILPIRYATTVSNIWTIITTAGVTPTAGENFFGLYSMGSTTAALLASGSADAVLTSTGAKSVAITPQVLQPGYYGVALMVNATTPPAIARNTGAASYGNVNLSTAQLRFFSNTTGNTTSLPASITLSGNTTANAGTQDFWVGVS